MRGYRAKLLRRAAHVMTQAVRNRPIVKGTEKPASIYRQLKKHWHRYGNVFQWQ